MVSALAPCRVPTHQRTCRELRTKSALPHLLARTHLPCAPRLDVGPIQMRHRQDPDKILMRSGRDLEETTLLSVAHFYFRLRISLCCTGASLSTIHGVTS